MLRGIPKLLGREKTCQVVPTMPGTAQQETAKQKQLSRSAGFLDFKLLQLTV